MKKSDHGMSAEQFDCKYNPDGDGEHPTLTRSLWRYQVANELTLFGYWEWVAWNHT